MVGVDSLGGVDGVDGTEAAVWMVRRAWTLERAWTMQRTDSGWYGWCDWADGVDDPACDVEGMDDIPVTYLLIDTIHLDHRTCSTGAG